MTETWMWGLITSLIIVAIGAILKSAHDAFLLKQTDKEVAALLSEIESLKKAHDEAISRIQESKVAEVTKLTERVVVLEEALKSKHRRSLDYLDALPPGSIG